MSDDDVQTVRMLKSCRKLMAERIEAHKGRVVDSPGDNLLSEFASVADAVQCAVDIQQGLAEKNQDLPAARKMEFRIGINLGDVIQDGDQIYGDGLNIAARLEGIAPGGGICISGSAFDQVKKLLPLGYEFLGEKQLKNISDKVRVYRIITHSDKPGKVIYANRQDDPRFRRRKRFVFALVCILFLCAVGIVRHKVMENRQPGAKTSLKDKIMRLHLPKKPSLAVLPFENMSEDPDQDYFSDGLTEDLITDLSQVSGLFVIARNSVFTYKGKAVKIDQIGKELGVRYVLEGSVRRQGDRVRITAQLIDAGTEGHVWAQRYDRDMKDIFTVQDEVRQMIVSALAVELTSDDQNRISKRKDANVEAYDFYLKGVELMSGKMKNGTAQARQMFEKAVELDPEFARAHAALAHTMVIDWIFSLKRDPDILDRATTLAERAIRLDPGESEGYSVLGHVYLWDHKHEKAIAQIRKAIDLEPGNAEWLAAMGEHLTWAGRYDEGIPYMEQAMRLDPKYPAWYIWNLGHAYYLTQSYDKAKEYFQRSLAKDPYFWPAHAYLALAFDALGQSDEAKIEIEAAANAVEGHTKESWEERLPYKDRELAAKIVQKMADLGLH